MVVRIAVPSKGRLREPTLKLLEAAGIEPLYGSESSRALVVPTSMEGVRLVFLRTEDIPGIVASGAVDLGFTGYDYLLEYGEGLGGLRVEARLGYGRAKLVVAAPVSSGVERIEDLPPGARVATKYVNIARRFFSSRGLDVRIIRISGASEAMPSLGAAEAVLDVASTGTTMALHGLRPIGVVLETEAVLVSGPKARDDWEAVEGVVELVRSVVRARGMKLVLMNVPDEKLGEVLEALPSMSGPMVARLESREPMWEVITAVRVEELPKTVLEAKRRGARDIVVLNLEKVIP